MTKATLSFPTNDSLWLFHQQTRAINVVVKPRTNTISGLFTPGEINYALAQLGAVEFEGDLATSYQTSGHPACRDRNELRGWLPEG